MNPYHDAKGQEIQPGLYTFADEERALVLVTNEDGEYLTHSYRGANMAPLIQILPKD